MTTNEKLGEISRIMSDGYHFHNFRLMMESIESEKTSATSEILVIIDRFWKLAKIAERGPSHD